MGSPNIYQHYGRCCCLRTGYVAPFPRYFRSQSELQRRDLAGRRRYLWDTTWQSWGQPSGSRHGFKSGRWERQRLCSVVTPAWDFGCQSAGCIHSVHGHIRGHRRRGHITQCFPERSTRRREWRFFGQPGSRDPFLGDSFDPHSFGVGLAAIAEWTSRGRTLPTLDPQSAANLRGHE